MKLKISRKFSKRVFDDGLAAVSDKHHPCHHMFTWQRDRGIRQVQLPEPFSGDYAVHRLVFVGLNPSLSENEYIPVASHEWSFNRYDEFYRSRFSLANRDDNGKPVVRLSDGDKELPRLWSNIERFGRDYLSKETNGSFLLGTHAILTEVVHYKSPGGWLGTRAQREHLLKHQSDFTRTLINEIAPCVLVPMGNRAYHQLCLLFDLHVAAQRTITEIMGERLRVRTKSGELVFIVPIKHLSYPPTDEKKAAVANQILHSIRSIN